MHPTAELQELAAQARAALRAVFGDDAAPEPPPSTPWKPHLSRFYGCAEFDDTNLESTLLSGAMPNEHSTVIVMPAQAVLVDQDTFGDRGFWWNADSARLIAIGGQVLSLSGSPIGHPAASWSP